MVPHLREAVEKTCFCFLKTKGARGARAAPSGAAALQPDWLHLGMAQELKQILKLSTIRGGSDPMSLGYSRRQRF